MAEHEHSSDGISVDGVYVFESHGVYGIQGIPSDAGPQIENRLAMQIVYDAKCVQVGMNGFTQPYRGFESFVSMPPMRFDSYENKGDNPAFPYYLSELIDAFRENKGQVLPKNRVQNISSSGFYPLRGTEVIISDDPYKPLVDIQGIGDDMDHQGLKAMNLQLAHNGNTTVVMSNTEHNITASMEFRTAENGGKFPAVAYAFTRIIKSMVAGNR